MVDQPQVEALGEHLYLVRAPQGDETVQIQIHATTDAIRRLAGDETDEARVIEATVAYLLARQRADDLPADLDLEDVAVAYEGFEEDMRTRFAAK